MSSIARKVCRVEGCDKDSKKLGYCGAHYQKYRLASITKICEVQGCKKTVYMRNWCTTHFWRWRRWGNPTYTKHPPHGLSNTTEFVIWVDIKMRCYNENDPAYKNYGGRHISMYSPWIDSFLSFYDYLKNTIGLRPDKNLTLDRIDNNKNYEPGNLRWATKEEQQNNKRNNIKLTLGNRSQTITQWCQELGLNYATVKSRIRNGWSDAEALSLDGRPIEKITINDSTKTIREWANISNISPNTIRRRVRAGWAKDRLLEPVDPQELLIRINGESKRLYEWAKLSGLSRNTIKKRINNGWGEEHILDKPNKD